LELNFNIHSWKCPICSKSSKPNEIFIDTYIQKIINESNKEDDKILIYQNGSYKISNNKIVNEVIEIFDDVDYSFIKSEKN
jgi:hypothetical protein